MISTESQFFFTSIQLNRLFPFYMLIDADLRIVEKGVSLKKITQHAEINTLFNSCFSIKRPEINPFTFENLKTFTNKLIIFQYNLGKTFTLKGQLEYIEATNELLFLGTPWFKSIEEIKENELTLNHFAAHDPLVDLLHLIKAQEIVNNDSKSLLTTINKQKNDLKKFSLIAQETVNGVIIADAKGKIEWINRAFSTITGYSLEEVVGKTPGSFLQGNNTDKNTINYLRRQIQSALPFECEILNYSKQGKPYWVKINGQPIFDINGNVQQFFALEEDITQRKFAEESLRIAEERWQFALEGAGDGVWEYDSIENKTFFSVAYKKMLGYEDDELKNDVAEFRSRVHPEDLHLIDKDDEAYQKGLINHHKREYRIRNKQGEYIWISDRGMVISRDEHNKPTRFIGTHTDITDKKIAEQKLEEQRKFYEGVLNEIPSDIAVFDAEHRYLFLNPIAVKDEVLRKWMIGKKDEDYCLLKNKPMSIAHDRRTLFNQVVESKQMLVWEETITNKHGETEYHLRNMYPVLNEQGNVKMVIGYGMNITERRTIEKEIERKEKRYRDLFNYSQALICTHDLDGNILSVNPAICNLLGYSSDEMIGQNLSAFIEKRDADKFRTNYLSIIQKEEVANGLFKVLNKNGNSLYLLYKNYKVIEDGLQPYVIGFSQDITDRIKAENELLIAKKMTEDSALAKEKFLANMSHEIRTPMNGILGIAGLISKTKLTIQQQNYVKLIKESANNLLVIVNDVLDIEKIAAGKLEFESLHFDIGEKLQTTLQSFQYKAEEKGVFLQLINNLPKNLVVKGDPFRLSQIFNNLISNALKFTQKGSITISAETVSVNEKETELQFKVIDSGIGISNDKLAIIFDPFIQASTDTTRKYGGTGLGLTICKSLVEMQGGQISVTSKENVGTTFTFIIPFDLGNENEIIKDNDLTGIDQEKLGKKRILVAEDVELNRFIIKHILESWGVEIDIAYNGFDAVEKVKTNHYDLILMDIQMPVMDGIEATKAIRELTDSNKANIPIIALTANALKGNESIYLDAGMNASVTKPYTEQKLFSTVNNFLSTEPDIKNIEDASILTNTTIEERLYNLDTINQLGNNSAVFAKSLLKMFIEKVPSDVDKMVALCQEENWQQIAFLTHKLKATVHSLNINSLKPIIEILEHIDKHSMLEKVAIVSLVNEFKNYIDIVVEQMKADLENM